MPRSGKGARTGLPGELAGPSAQNGVQRLKAGPGGAVGFLSGWRRRAARGRREGTKKRGLEWGVVGRRSRVPCHHLRVLRPLQGSPGRGRTETPGLQRGVGAAAWGEGWVGAQGGVPRSGAGWPALCAYSVFISDAS